MQEHIESYKATLKELKENTVNIIMVQVATIYTMGKGENL